MPRMEPLPPAIADKLDEVRALCGKYHVKRLSIFGSAVKGTFDPETSDVDFVVEFEEHPDPVVMGGRYLELWEGLKDLYGRNIDLIVASTIRSQYFRQEFTRAHLDLYAA
jgi:predicted nucleotidyltransferase